MKLPAITLSLFVFLQAPVVPPQPSQLPKGTIEGMVVRVGTSEPIGGVQVTLTRVIAPPGSLPVTAAPAAGATPPVPLAPIPPATTDRQGKYVIKDLEAGSYRITAARNGYARQEYGQRVAGAQGTVVNLASGQALKDVSFVLTPAGNVSGRVRDLAGEPVTGLQVQLLRAAYNPAGQKTLQTAGSARTDDRGEYRMYWVTPGRYYLSVSTTSRIILDLGGVSSPNEVAPKPYPTTYFPGTIDASKASVIDVQAGVEVSAVDVVLPQQDSYRIRGRVVDSVTGQSPRNVGISITPRQTVGTLPLITASAGAPPYNPAAGTFELRDVAPGAYWLRATVSPDLSAPVAANTTARTVTDLLDTYLLSRVGTQVQIDVAGADIDGVTLVLTPGVSIPGRLRIEGQELSTVNGSDRIRITLRASIPNAVPAPRTQPINADGTFTMDNVMPGEYRLSATTPQPDIYLKEARLDSADVLNQPWLISGPVSGTLNLVLGAGAGQVDGNVVNEKSEPVRGIQAVLIPDRFRDRTELFKTATTDQNGHFTIRGIPPGDYKVFAWEVIEQFSYFDADVLRPFEQKGKAVTVTESSKVTAEVQVIPATQ